MSLLFNLNIYSPPATHYETYRVRSPRNYRGGLIAAASDIVVVSLAIQLAENLKVPYDFWRSIAEALELTRAMANVVTNMD
jgi:hypothetical protein